MKIDESETDKRIKEIAKNQPNFKEVSADTKAKKGDCKECGQNENNRPLGLIYRYKSDDMVLVQDHIQRYLTDYNRVKSVTPIWCDDCKALIEYSVELNNEKSN